MPRAGLSPDVVTETAARLADEIGFEHVTASAVAERLGVRVASLYSHVRGTGDLRTRVALLALRELADLAAEAVAGRAGHDALVALADVHRDYARAHPGRHDATTLRLDPETAAASAGVRLAQLNRAVLRGYRLEGDAQTHAVRLVGSTIRGFVDLERAGGFDHSRPDSEASWRWLLDSLDALLRTLTTLTTVATPTTED